MDLHIWSPESEIVPKELHDESAILVGFLTQSVQFSNSFLKCLYTRKRRFSKNLAERIRFDLHQVSYLISAYSKTNISIIRKKKVDAENTWQQPLKVYKREKGCKAQDLIRHGLDNGPSWNLYSFSLS